MADGIHDMGGVHGRMASLIHIEGYGNSYRPPEPLLEVPLFEPYIMCRQI